MIFKQCASSLHAWKFKSFLAKKIMVWKNVCSLLMGSVVFVQVEHPNVTVINRVKRGTGSLPQHSVWSANHFCGGDFTQLSGILRSPGFPLYYPNNKVNSTSLFQKANFCPKIHFYFSSLFLVYVLIRIFAPKLKYSWIFVLEF